MNDKRTILIWGGLLGVMITIFLMNNWINGQLEEDPMPSQRVVRPAVPSERVQPSYPIVAVAVQELATAEDALAANPQESAQPGQNEAEDPNIVYETPLVDPILPQ